MVITQVASESRNFIGLRPINLARDAPAVSRLLSLVFSPTLDAEGRRALEVMFHGSSLFIQRLSRLSSGVSPGFVWEDQGAIVGNVSIIASAVPGRYIIANVAVHPDYRRQHIGRQLTGEALRHLQERGARSVVLQVEIENTTALHLYQTLGFFEVGSTTLWQASPRALRRLPASGGYPIRLLRRREADLAYEIDVAAVPADLNWPEPTAVNSYEESWWRWLDNFLNGRQSETWVIPDQRDRPLALGSIWSEWGQPHRLTVRAPAAWQTTLSQPLLSKLLRRLEYLRQRPVVIEHPSDDVTLNALLPQVGFHPRRTLTTMKCYLT